MINKNEHIHISITSTGRCNRGCKYCHFYASHNREEVDRDMDWQTFTGYVNFIKNLLKDGYDITVRFSGGEPLFIKEEKIYEMSDYIFENTGLEPYVMTNGKLLSKETIDKAAEHHISTFVVSCENPFKESEGAEHVEDVIEKYLELKNYNSKVSIELGLVLIENSEFKNITKIADFFYERIGSIPPFSEKNFDTYERPTEQELLDLENSTRELVKKYNGIADMHLFPYIIPELYNNTEDDFKEHLIEFPLDDIHEYGKLDYINALKKMNEVFDKNNISYYCPNKECELREYCTLLKWVWFDTTVCNEGEKLQDYCLMKKALVRGYFHALYDDELKEGVC